MLVARQVLKLAALGEEVDDYFLFFVKHEYWLCEPLYAFVLYVCPVANFGDLGIVILVPSIKPLRVEISHVVSAVEHDHAAEYVPEFHVVVLLTLGS